MSNSRLGLIRCEHCGRQFNPHSGARHIPWCAKQQSENRKQNLTAEKREALERYRWRVNYKPSNQINNYRRANIIAENQARNCKKSSLNSSLTLSSPSTASSITSAGSNSLASLGDSNSHRAKHMVARANARQQASSKPVKQPIASKAPLKRSISSLTLTKQRGVTSGLPSDHLKSPAISNQKADSNESTTLYLHQLNQRAKSHSDLSNMSEIVETLAKRIDEIYAQNRILLAKISNPKGRSTKSNDSDLENESDDDEDDIDNHSSGTYFKCHHCKSSCLERANYCHKCGCRIQTTTSSSSPTS